MNLQKVVLPLELKRMCLDIALYEYFKISTSNPDTCIANVHKIFENDTIGTEQSYLDCVKYFIKNSALFNKIETEYKNNCARMQLKGERNFYKESSIFYDLAEVEMKKRNLFGNRLDEAIKNAATQYSNDFDASKWGGVGTPLSSLKRLVNISKRIYNSTEEKDIISDISIGEEDKLYSKSILELEDKLSSNSNLVNLFEDRDFYVESMQNIYRASNILFGTRSNLSSNLSSLYCSIMNCLQTEEVSDLIAEISKTTEVNEKNMGVLTTDKWLGLPYKKREFNSSRDEVPVWEGHLPYVSIRYAKESLGNADMANKCVRLGLTIFKNLRNAYIRVNNNDAIDLAISVTNEIKRLLLLETEETLEYRKLTDMLNKHNIKDLILGVNSAYLIKFVLKSVGKSLITFSCVEIRQNTWNRFSNLKELMQYYKVHETLSGEVNAQEYLLNLVSNVSIEDIVKTGYSKIEDEYLANILNSKISGILRIGYEESSNTLNISDRQLSIINLLKMYINRFENKVDNKGWKIFYSIISDLVFTMINIFLITNDILDDLSLNLHSSCVRSLDVRFKPLLQKQKRHLDDIIRIITPEYKMPLLLRIKEMSLSLSSCFNSDGELTSIAKSTDLILQYLEELDYSIRQDKILGSSYERLNDPYKSLIYNCVNAIMYIGLDEIREDLFNHCITNLKASYDFIKKRKPIDDALIIFLPLFDKNYKWGMNLNYLSKINNLMDLQNHTITHILKRYGIESSVGFPYYKSAVKGSWDITANLFEKISTAIKEIRDLLNNSELKMKRVEGFLANVKHPLTKDLAEVENAIIREESRAMYSRGDTESLKICLERFGSMVVPDTSIIAIKGTPLYMEKGNSDLKSLTNTTQKFYVYSIKGYKAEVPVIGKEVNIEVLTMQEVSQLLERIETLLKEE